MKQSIKQCVASEQSFFFAVPALVWQLLFFYTPLIFVVLISFKQLGAGVFSRFIMENYIECFSLSFLYITLRSLTLSFFTAFFCLILGYPVAYYLARRAVKWKNFLLFFLVVPFWTNMLVQVYAWFAILEYKGLLNNFLMKLGVVNEPLLLLNTHFAIYLVMIYYYIPFMIIPIYAILEKLEDEYIEASLDLGATPVQTFFRVTLPLSMSGIITGFFLVFVPAFGEFVIPGLMGGNKFMCVGSLISYYYLNVHDESLGAACTVLSLLVLVTASFLLYRFFALFVKTEREI